MRGRWTGAWVVVLAACTTAIAISVTRAIRGRQLASAATAHLRLVSTQVSDLAALTSSKPSLPRTSDGPGMGARIASVLAACGLPASAMTSVSPEADTRLTVPESTARYLRSRVTLTLAGVTLPQLGSFLNGWRTAEPAWVPTALEITPTQPKEGFPGGDRPLNITIVLEGLFEDDAGGAR
jgi:hypothetical protein